MLVVSLFLILIAQLASCDGQRSYDGWSLIKAYPSTDTQTDYLNSLRENDTESSDVQIWAEGHTRRPFDILLSPNVRRTVLSNLARRGIKYSTVLYNVQRTIDAEKRPFYRGELGIKNSQWFTKFLRLEEINDALRTLARDNPHLVSLESIGTTHEGRSIMMAKVSVKSARSKPAIWLDGGIHAREWISTSTVLYTLNELVSEYNDNGSAKALVDGLTWYIVPVLNPDGYDYTHNSDRMWRKNRRPRSCTGWRCCEGVDLNRNFAYGFGGAGTSKSSCDSTYRGTSAFSEPESKAVRSFILGHKDLQAYLTLHSYSQMWFYPYGDRVNSIPPDGPELEALAKRAAKALAAVHGTRYDVGTAANLLYPSGGGSDDWAKGVAGVKYVYCLELRPNGRSIGNGFLLPAAQIVPTGEETWAGLRVVAEAIVERRNA